MTLVDAIKTCMFQKYLTFSGRATKAEFWKFILFVVPYLGWAIIVAIVLVTHLGGSETVSQLQANGQATTPVSPRLAITMVLAFLCVIILNTYWLVQPSDPGPNKYGPNPHEVSP